jgi:glycosyltransferase involved in cell wall biosynthesis
MAAKKTARRSGTNDAAARLKSRLQGKRIAVLHDWLNGMRGGEKVLENILQLLPREETNVELFTLVYEPDKVSEFIRSYPVRTSFIQKLPFGRRKYRSWLPLFPQAVESLSARLRGFDLVLGTSHCVVKGAIVPTAVPHFSYIHSPMRYVWDLFEDYFPAASTGRIKKLLLHHFSHRLRIWDTASASRPDLLMANSSFIGRRIRRFWGRESAVVYPPCGSREELQDNLNRALPMQERDPFYLLVTAFAPYKKTSLAVEAFVQSGRPLMIVGTGQEEKYLKKLAGDSGNITFTGRLEAPEVADYMRRARGFIYPGIEDFGIAMVEAQSHGTPVLAFGQGGVLETVIPGKTGHFFHKQTAESLNTALAEMEGMDFRLDSFRKNVLRFSNEDFQQNFARQILKFLEAGS